MISRSKMPKQMMPGPKGPKPKNMGGKLPAAIGRQKTDHGKMNFAMGGKVRGKKGC